MRRYDFANERRSTQSCPSHTSVLPTTTFCFFLGHPRRRSTRPRHFGTTTHPLTSLSPSFLLFHAQLGRSAATRSRRHSLSVATALRSCLPPNLASSFVWFVALQRPTVAPSTHICTPPNLPVPANAPFPARAGRYIPPFCLFRCPSPSRAVHSFPTLSLFCSSSCRAGASRGGRAWQLSLVSGSLFRAPFDRASTCPARCPSHLTVASMNAELPGGSLTCSDGASSNATIVVQRASDRAAFGRFRRWIS